MNPSILTTSFLLALGATLLATLLGRALLVARSAAVLLQHRLSRSLLEPAFRSALAERRAGQSTPAHR